YLRVESINIPAVKLALDAMKALGDLGIFRAQGIDFGHPVRQRLLLLFHVAELVEDGHALVEHRAAGERQPVLRQVPDGEALHASNGARVESVEAGQDAQQRGLAGSVGPDYADALV